MQNTVFQSAKIISRILKKLWLYFLFTFWYRKNTDDKVDLQTTNRSEPKYRAGNHFLQKPGSRFDPKRESRFDPKHESRFGSKHESRFGPKRESCFDPKRDSVSGIIFGYNILEF